MNPCESCHAGCCRSFAIPVSGADILRIERNLKLSFWEVACRWADSSGKIAGKYAPHFFFEDEPETPFVIALLKSSSEYFSSSQKCRFLMEGQPDEEHPFGVARCGIYESRPAACRCFPTRFNDVGDLVVLNEVPNRTSENAVRIRDLCSRQWTTEDVDVLDTFSTLSVARDEMIFFHRVAQVWNGDSKPWTSFPAFLNMVYKRRVVYESELKSESEAPDIIKTPGVWERQQRRAA